MADNASLSSSFANPSNNHLAATLNTKSHIGITVFAPVKLHKHNFLIWKSQVLPTIRENDLESFIDGSKVVSTL